MNGRPPDTASGSCRRCIGIYCRHDGHNHRVLRRLPVLALAALLGLTGCASGATSTTSTASAPIASSTTAPAPVRPTVVTITSADVPMPSVPSVPSVPAATPAPDAPQRIVSLATGVGETLAALGVADRVVGRDETSDVPDIAGAPIVTRAHAISAERVLAVDPDLVIVDRATSPPEALEQIRSTGVRIVLVPEAWTIADIGPRTRAIAAAVGVSEATADAVIASAARSAAPTSGDGPRVAFLYLRGTSAVYLLGGAGSGADALVAAAGGTDVGAQAGLAAFVPLTAEALVAADPEVLLVMTKGLESVGGVDGLVQLPGVAQSTAGRERRVIAVDDTLLLSFGPRTGVLVDQLAAALDQVEP